MCLLAVPETLVQRGGSVSGLQRLFAHVLIVLCGV
jgi:hypothetical protein